MTNQLHTIEWEPIFKCFFFFLITGYHLDFLTKIASIKSMTTYRAVKAFLIAKLFKCIYGYVEKLKRHPLRLLPHTCMDPGSFH